MTDVNALVDRIRRGDRRSLARAMTQIAGDGPAARALQDRVRAASGNTPWWGFTGPPGVGKSTLIDRLLDRLRERGRRIGVVAIDPSSPIGKGALLGDRVRMMQHAVNEDIFIRSLATHGCPGGLSDATMHCARLLELAGFDPVVIETVGVGQDETDIAGIADVCAVVLGPGYGDDIQLIKAGLLEIADIVVVNKCDLPEGARLVSEIREELDLSSGRAARGRGRSSSDTPGDQLSGADVQRTDVVAVKAKWGGGVEDLLNRMLALDQQVRTAERRAELRRRRAISEVRRQAVLAYEQAFTEGLEEDSGGQLLSEFEGGRLSLEAVITRLGPAVARRMTKDADGANEGE